MFVSRTLRWWINLILLDIAIVEIITRGGSANLAWYWFFILGMISAWAMDLIYPQGKEKKND